MRAPNACAFLVVCLTTSALPDGCERNFVDVGPAGDDCGANLNERCSVHRNLAFLTGARSLVGLYGDFGRPVTRDELIGGEPIRPGLERQEAVPPGI
jgi:hypothetical protein